MAPKFVSIDGLKIWIEPQNGTVHLYCGNELDSLTTLINLFPGMRPGATSQYYELAKSSFENFVHGIPFLSDGFWTRRFEREETASLPEVGAFRKRWESMNGQELKQPVWLCVNDWNDATIYLVEATFRKIITFAYEFFKLGMPVPGPDFEQYKSPIFP